MPNIDLCLCTLTQYICNSTHIGTFVYVCTQTQHTCTHTENPVSKKVGTQTQVSAQAGMGVQMLVTFPSHLSTLSYREL